MLTFWTIVEKLFFYMHMFFYKAYKFMGNARIWAFQHKVGIMISRGIYKGFGK